MASLGVNRSLLPARKQQHGASSIAIAIARHSNKHAAQLGSSLAVRPARPCLHVRRFRESDRDMEFEEGGQVGAVLPGCCISVRQQNSSSTALLHELRPLLSMACTPCMHVRLAATSCGL
jgi:hypothetical protein